MGEQNASDTFPILVVEDERVSRAIVEKVLIQMGYDVVAVENGRQALDLLRERFFPIILTDWVMPEMDGLELCRQIRSDVFPGYIFIILLTSMDTKSDIIEGVEAGADEYLIKPLDMAELMARLKTAKRILRLEQSLKQANEEIRQLAITDRLTGVYNRGYFNERIPVEIRRSQRYSHSFSLILCDIDHFKKVNDTYGHLVGDEVLKTFVQYIQTSIREDVDLLFRYGGEEFTLLLPVTNMDNAIYTAERIRKTVETSPIETQEITINITASFGVTCFDPDTTEESITHDSMVRIADQCLYECKREGRNRVKGQIM